MEGDLRPHKKIDPNTSAPDDSQDENRRSSAAQFLERMVSNSALNAPDSPSEDKLDRISGSNCPGASEPLYSPQSHPSATELFTALDNESVDHLLDNITPELSTNPELTTSSFQDADAAYQANTNSQNKEDKVEIVDTETSIDAKVEEPLVEGVETEVEIAKSAQKVKNTVTGNEDIDDVPETVKPDQTQKQVNGSPVPFPQSTTPDLSITPRTSLLNSPVTIGKPLQAAMRCTPTTVKMSTFSR